MKKLGNLILDERHFLSKEELIKISGGLHELCNAPICNQCVDSAPAGCEVSCGNDHVCYTECVVNQSGQCMDMYGCTAYGC